MLRLTARKERSRTFIAFGAEAQVIVVATTDFEVYHGVVNELRERGTTFTTVELDDELPDHADVVITGTDHADDFANVTTIVADSDDPRRAVDQALAAVRGDGGRTIIGVDPGRKPGIAVLAGETVVAAFQVPLGDAVDLIQREAAEAPSPVVRIGDGSRLENAKLVTDLDDVRVELVDGGNTPTLAPGREEWVTCSLRSISLGSRDRSSTI